MKVETQSRTRMLISLLTVFTFLFSAGLIFFDQQEAHAGKDCARKAFKTKMYEKACKKGGQKEAKKVARKFMKKAKKATKQKITCRTCHTKSSGKYPLKKNGLELFKQFKKAM